MMVMEPAEEPALDPTTEWLKRISDPLALVSPSGEILEANGAFRALIEPDARCHLAELFSIETLPLLVEALREGHAQTAQPLPFGTPPRAHFRLSITRETDGTCAVLLRDASSEVGCRRELALRDESLNALKQVGAMLSETIEIKGLTERIYRLISPIFGTTNFYLALLDRETKSLSFPQYVEDGLRKEMTSRSWSNGLTEYVLTTARPLLLNRDVLERAQALGVTPLGRPCQAWLGAPMIINQDAIGVLGIQDYEASDCYDNHDVQMLSIIAAQAAAAIRTARLLSAARRACEELWETQARLLETERLRGVTETVGALNHEINNPLAAIAGNAQLLLRRRQELAQDAITKLQTILNETHRIQRVTGKMATLIQATSMPYPGQSTIIDVHHSISGEESMVGSVPEPPSGVSQG